MFYYPNKPVRIYDVDKFVETLDDNWIAQPKLNGKRVLPCFDQEKFSLFNRHGAACKETNHFSFLKKLIPGPFLLDGEYLRNGNIVIWDYAVLNGDEEYTTEYSYRLSKLSNLMKDIHHPKFSMVNTMPAKFYPKILSEKSEFLEGIVFKNLRAKNLWGIYSTNDVGSQVKFRLK